ncbi:MAG: hypothetical protein HY222_00700 [Thaumarchaeota archaeon]|nr:hypothetical protein [Nitrososphaerota archaeon]MBI3640904.1 hypothetical protein [Nitrososphaerota archaeon]
MSTIENSGIISNSRFLAKSLPWRQSTFIPEIRFHNPKILEAFREFDVSPKVATVNYHDLKKYGFLSDSKLKRLNELIGPVDALILNSIGKDRLLDQITVEEYHNTVSTVGAKAAFTIDDYIYAHDNSYPNFQMGNFGRSMNRAQQLMDLAQNDYSIIGLVFGKDKNWMRIHVDFLTSLGIHDFAFSSGDLWKNRTKYQIKQIENFLTITKDIGCWNMLVGFDTKRELFKYRPDSFSSIQWIFDGSTYMITKNDKHYRAKHKSFRLHDESYALKDRRLQLALHNLIENYHIGQEMRK